MQRSASTSTPSPSTAIWFRPRIRTSIVRSTGLTASQVLRFWRSYDVPASLRRLRRGALTPCAVTPSSASSVRRRCRRRTIIASPDSSAAWPSDLAVTSSCSPLSSGSPLLSSAPSAQNRLPNLCDPSHFRVNQTFWRERVFAALSFDVGVGTLRLRSLLTPSASALPRRRLRVEVSSSADSGIGGRSRCRPGRHRGAGGASARRVISAVPGKVMRSSAQPAPYLLRHHLP